MLNREMHCLDSGKKKLLYLSLTSCFLVFLKQIKT